VIELSIKPWMRVTADEPIEVVATSAALDDKVIDVTYWLMSVAAVP
jgi:hypothetical protein